MLDGIEEDADRTNQNDLKSIINGFFSRINLGNNIKRTTATTKIPPL